LLPWKLLPLELELYLGGLQVRLLGLQVSYLLLKVVCVVAGDSSLVA
jgi:hypothetical protein